MTLDEIRKAAWAGGKRNPDNIGRSAYSTRARLAAHGIAKMTGIWRIFPGARMSWTKLAAAGCNCGGSRRLWTGNRPGKVGGIFGAFVTTKPKGLGLGLAICQMIVERHGGQLSAWSEKKRRGALCQFTLPIKPAAERV